MCRDAHDEQRPTPRGLQRGRSNAERGRHADAERGRNTHPDAWRQLDQPAAQYPNAPAGSYPNIAGSFVVDGSGRLVAIDVDDGRAKPGDTLFVSSQSGLSPTGFADAGSWKKTFTADPGFVLAQAASAPSTPTPASSAQSAIAGPSTGGAPVAAEGSPWWGWAAAALALLALGGVLTLLRARS